MSVSNCIPKPFDNSLCEYVQLAARCTPLIGFLAVYQHDKEFTVFEQLPTDASLNSPFIEHSQDYSKSQKIAGIISVIIGAMLIILGLPQVLGLPGLIWGGIAAGMIGLIHFAVSGCMSHNDLIKLKQEITDAEAKFKAEVIKINQDYERKLEANRKIRQQEQEYHFDPQIKAKMEEIKKSYLEKKKREGQ